MFISLLFAGLCSLTACQDVTEMDMMLINLVNNLDECKELGFLCKVHKSSTEPMLECINKTLVCNGKDDCSNYVDELACGSRFSGGVTCRDGGTKAMTCNGVAECEGGEDELHCPTKCPDGEVLCNDGITCTRPCDTTNPCPDGENIWNCGVDCDGTSVLCRDLMHCATKCDGNRECTTAEDEACPFQCLCRQKQYICNGNSERCIDRSKFCNEVTEECPMGEDENCS